MSAATVLNAFVLAGSGLAMPLPAPIIIGGMLIVSIALALVLDLVKSPVFARLKIA